MIELAGELGGYTMSLVFRKTLIEDIETLLLIQKSAFQEDWVKYEDFD